MIVELIGPSGAGKSTLARQLCQRLDRPAGAIVGSDLVLAGPVLRRVHHAQVANVVQDVRGLPHLTRSLPTHAGLLRLSATILAAHAPSRFDLVMNTRSVMRRLGMYELAKTRASGRFVILDEGPLLIAYHLFVYSNVDLASAPVEQFAASVPIPDVVVYLRCPVTTLVERSLSRPDPRRQLAGMTRSEVEVPLRRALAVFDRLVTTPRLQPRTVVVENGRTDGAELASLLRTLAGKSPSGTPTIAAGR